MSRITLNEESGHITADNVALRNNLSVAGTIGGGKNGVLTLGGQVNMPGNLNVTGRVTVTGSITTPVDNTISVPSPSYPTIQSAIDWFNGRNVMNATINIAPGVYGEQLKLDKLTSNRGGLNLTGDYSWLTIQADTRGIGGSYYQTNALAANPLGIPGLGGNYGQVTLSNIGNVISVSTSYDTVDFGAAGLVPGDQIIILDNNWDFYLANVLSVTGNTITHDAGTVDVGLNDSSITLLNNTTLYSPYDYSDIMTLVGCGATIIGLNFSTEYIYNTGSPIINMLRLIDGAKVILKNCVFDDSSFNMWDGCIHATGGSSVMGSDGETDSYQAYVNTVLGGETGLWLESKSCLYNGYWNFSVADNLPVHVDDSTMVTYEQVQACDEWALIYAQNFSNVNLGSFSLQDCAFGVFAQGNCQITLGSDNSNSISNAQSGIYILENSKLLVYGQIYMDQVGNGLVLSSNSSSMIFENIYITNLDNFDVNIDETSTHNQHFDTVPSYNGTFSVLQNVITYTDNEVLRPAYKNQLIDQNGGPINLSFGPTWTDWDFGWEYKGKVFTLSSANNQAHTLTLDGNFFVGNGANGTSNYIATFSTAGSTMTFLILPSGTVQVLSQNGVTFSP